MKSIALGTACVAAGAALPSQPAAGGAPPTARAVLGQAKGLTYVVKQKQITDADPVVVTNCPNGTAVTGGGTLIDTGFPTDAEITNSTPQPAGDPAQKPDEGWLSEGHLASFLDGATMLSYAICSDRPSKLRYRSTPVFVPGSSTMEATAQCPAGTVLTGGGALTDSELGDMVIASAWPDGAGPVTSFSANAENRDTEQHSLVAYAICSKEESKYSVRIKTAPISGVPFASGNLVVNCRNAAVSGGGAGVYGGTSDDDAWLPASSPQPAGDPNKVPKKGWIAEGVSEEAETLAAYAVCRE